MSFVKGHQQWRTHGSVLSRFTLGFTLAAVSVLAFAAVVGLGVRHLTGTRASVFINVVGLSGAFVLDVYAVRKTKWCPLTVRRQAPQGIMYEFGMKRAALAWGLDTGLLFSTFRVSAISWAVMLGCLTGLASWWIGLVYAAGFLFPLVLTCSIGGIVSGPEPPQIALAFLKGNMIVRVIAATALAVSLIVLAAGVL